MVVSSSIPPARWQGQASGVKHTQTVNAIWFWFIKRVSGRDQLVGLFLISLVTQGRYKAKENATREQLFAANDRSLHLKYAFQWTAVRHGRTKFAANHVRGERDARQRWPGFLPANEFSGEPFASSRRSTGEPGRTQANSAELRRTFGEV